PGISTRRGASLGSEFRYLEPHYSGLANLDLMPNDRLTGRSRYALTLGHDAALVRDTQLAVHVLRVSDDDYWKDFQRSLPTLTPRLLLSDVQATRPLGDWTAYLRAMRWQVLQQPDAPIDPTVTPGTPQALVTHLYERLPQIGARTVQRHGGFEFSFEGEYNQFARPVDVPDDGRLTGSPLP